MTVSGLTIARAWRQPGHRQDRMTQKTLSAFRSNGRGLFRFRTATCCRRARISVWSAARSAKISMILCMPERVSGGDAEFQGFCDGWNKWEGQAILYRWICDLLSGSEWQCVEVVSSVGMKWAGSRSWVRKWIGFVDFWYEGKLAFWGVLAFFGCRRWVGTMWGARAA